MTDQLTEDKRIWLDPAFTKTSLIEATLGSGGSSCDGNETLTQAGSGNDSDDDCEDSDD